MYVRLNAVVVSTVGKQDTCLLYRNRYAELEVILLDVVGVLTRPTLEATSSVVLLPSRSTLMSDQACCS